MFDGKVEENSGAIDPIPSCVNLLRQMELADSDEESDLLDPAVKENEEELTNLPNEWQYPELGLFSTNEDSFLVSSQVNNIAQTVPSSVP